MRFKSIPAALAVAAALCGCVSPVPYNDLVSKSATYQDLDAQLKPRVAADRMQLEQLQNLVRVTLADGLLFPEGSAKLDEAGKAMLVRLAPALKDLSGQRIVIKGFTDNVPTGPTLRERLAGNVELSKARADAVAGALEAQGVSAALIATVGLGETHAAASNATAAGRARNRRVEIDVVEAPA
ncbi:MAG TPA: OmpA family protein [Rubrivivax sp.]|nr:OmpA family protein [Rubrivivax sp.]